MDRAAHSEFPVSKEQLMTLQSFKLNQLAEEQRVFRSNWKNNNECNCVSNLSHNELPRCIHIRKEMKEQFKEKENQIWRRTIIIGAKSFPFNKLFN